MTAETPAPFDLHFAYATLIILSAVMTFAFPVTAHFRSKNDKRRYYIMQAITAVAAIFGAKFAVLLGDALWPMQEFHDWYGLLGSGRSIVGALLFGFLAVEAAKPLLGYDIPPNDRFALILPFSIGFGRLGCLMAGCCLGLPYNGPLAISYADGIPRHPAPLYEMAFNFAMAIVLILLWRRNLLFGRLFALYLTCYGVFRFFIEFVRETAKPYYGLSAYQWMCFAMILAGGTALVVRTWRQPAAWAAWRTQNTDRT